MKIFEGIEYYDIEEISEDYLINYTQIDVKLLLEEGKINGKIFENKWYADKEAIDNYIKLFLNEKYFTFGPLKVDLRNIKINGTILDIGGGGEAVIEQFMGEKVVAIDPSKRELEEAPDSGALNIIMDAKDLKFLDKTFDSVSSFFTMMYIPNADHKKIFEEIYRILKINGEFFLWDLRVPKRQNKDKKVYVVLLKIKIPEKIIDAGYGIRWEKEQDAHHFLKVGQDIGFEVLEQNIEDNIFYIKFRKI